MKSLLLLLLLSLVLLEAVSSLSAADYAKKEIRSFASSHHRNLLTTPTPSSSSFTFTTEQKAALHRAQRLVQQRDIKDEVAQIIGLVQNGSAHHQAYQKLATFVDTFGHRLCGSESHMQAAQGLVEMLQGWFEFWI